MINKEILSLREIENPYDRAFQLVSILFSEKKDKAGVPYLRHLLDVSNRLDTLEDRTIGLLHDVVEDIEGFHFSDLEKLGFSSSIVEAVRIVTRDKMKKQSYHEWITEIINTGNVSAIAVKYADILDHLDPDKLNLLNSRKREYFLEKYSNEEVRLQGFLETYPIKTGVAKSKKKVYTSNKSMIRTNNKLF